MDITKLISISNDVHAQLVDAIKEYVRENGEEMSDYYYNEFGMYEEDEDGMKITSVLDTSEVGCFFARQFEVNDESLNDIGRHDEGFEVYDKLLDSFHYATYWAFYIVRDSDGNEDLKYYSFYNDGVCYEDYSVPDHDHVRNLTLADLFYIIEALQIYDLK